MKIKSMFWTLVMALVLLPVVSSCESISRRAKSVNGTAEISHDENTSTEVRVSIFI